MHDLTWMVHHVTTTERRREEGRGGARSAHRAVCVCACVSELLATATMDAYVDGCRRVRGPVRIDANAFILGWVACVFLVRRAGCRLRTPVSQYVLALVWVDGWMGVPDALRLSACSVLISLPLPPQLA